MAMEDFNSAAWISFSKCDVDFWLSSCKSVTANKSLKLTKNNKEHVIKE